MMAVEWSLWLVGRLQDSAEVASGSAAANLEDESVSTLDE
jgi:hypothetical protein